MAAHFFQPRRRAAGSRSHMAAVALRPNCKRCCEQVATHSRFALLFFGRCAPPRGPGGELRASRSGRLGIAALSICAGRFAPRAVFGAAETVLARPLSLVAFEHDR